MKKTRELIGKWNKMCKNFGRWLLEQCKDWQTFLLLAIVALVLFSPSIVGFILGLVFDSAWGYAFAGAYWVFWMGPGTPFFVLVVTITLSIKRFIQVKILKKKLPEENAENASGEPTAEANGEQAAQDTSTESENTATEAEGCTAAPENTAADNGTEGTEI